MKRLVPLFVLVLLNCIWATAAWAYGVNGVRVTPPTGPGTVGVSGTAAGGAGFTVSVPIAVTDLPMDASTKANKIRDAINALGPSWHAISVGDTVFIWHVPDPITGMGLVTNTGENGDTIDYSPADPRPPPLPPLRPHRVALSGTPSGESYSGGTAVVRAGVKGPTFSHVVTLTTTSSSTAASLLDDLADGLVALGVDAEVNTSGVLEIEVEAFSTSLVFGTDDDGLEIEGTVGD